MLPQSEGRVIQCCKRNLPSEVRSLLDEERHSVQERFCLQRCGECYDTAFLVVDGAKIEYDAENAVQTLPSSLLTEEETA